MRPFIQVLVIALVLSAICNQSEAFKKKKKFAVLKKGGNDRDCRDSARPCENQQLVQQPVYQRPPVQVVERPAPVRTVAPVAAASVAAAPAVAASPPVAKVKVPKKAVKKAAKKLKKKAPKIKKLLKGLAKLGTFGGAGGNHEEDCDEPTSQPRVAERQVQYA